MNILQHKRREERPDGTGLGAGSGGDYGSVTEPTSATGAFGAAGTPPPAPPAPPPPPYGAPRPRPVDARLKSPPLAAFFSAIFPGVGQIYVGYYQRGITFALMFAAIITALASGTMHRLEPLAGIAIGFTWLLGIFDANRLAHLYNQVMQGLPGTELPDGVKLPQERGSYAGGVVLVLLGLLLFLNRNFDFSLEWLEDWWPVGLMGLGAWLIVKARRAHARD